MVLFVASRRWRGEAEDGKDGFLLYGLCHVLMPMKCDMNMGRAPSIQSWLITTSTS